MKTISTPVIKYLGYEILLSDLPQQTSSEDRFF